MRQHRLVVVSLVVALCLSLGYVASVHRAAASGGLTVSVGGYAAPGCMIGVYGTGFPLGDTIQVLYDSTVVGSTFVRGLGGPISTEFVTQITAPADTTTGTHTITASDQAASLSAQTTVLVHSNWDQFGFIPSGGRYNTNETTISTSNVANLTLDWTYTDGQQSSMARNAPSLYCGVLYIGTADTEYHALDSKTGRELWTTYNVAAFYNEPVILNGTIYTGGYSVYAINAANGHILWDSGKVPYLFLQDPVVANGLVYAGSSFQLYAFNAAGCGQLHCSAVWVSPNTGRSIQGRLTYANGVVYSAADELIAFDASNGNELWKSPDAPGYYAYGAAVANGIVYYGSTDTNLYAYSASGCGQATCSPLWKATAGTPLNTAPAIANGVVYMGSGDGHLYAFSASGCGQTTCSPLWSATIGTTSNAIVSAPAVANGVVFVGSSNGTLYAFNASGCGATTCSPLWSYTVGAAIWGPCVVANGMVFVGDRNETLYSFHLPGSSAHPHGPIPTPQRRQPASRATTRLLH